MIKNNKFMLITTTIIMLLPMVIGIILWSKLPDTMATHFGVNNEPDGWNSKPFAVFGLPALILAVHWICIYVTNVDSRYKSIPPKMLNILLWICPAASLLCTVLTYSFALGININIGFIINLFLGILYMVIGNYLPKCKQNSVMGMRIPWTINSEDNWYHTHRFAGWSMTIGGLIIFATAFLKNMWLFMAGFFIAILMPCVYSYLYYRKHN